MAYAKVQDKTGGLYTSPTTITPDATFTAGNFVLIAMVGFAYVERAITAVKNQSGTALTYYQLTTPAYDGGSLAKSYLLWIPNIPAGVTSISIEHDGSFSEGGEWIAREVSGISTTGNPLAGSASASPASPGTGTDALTSGVTGTLSAQPAMLSGFAWNLSNNAPPTAGTGFGNSAALTPATLEDKRVTATTAVAATFTAVNGAGGYIVLAAAFAEASTGSTGTLAATESGSDAFAATGGVGSNGIRLTLRDTDTGALAASLTGLIVSIRATSQASSLLITAVTNETTDGSGVLELASSAIGNVGDYVYVTVEKSDHSIVATYRVQVIDLNA